MAWLGTALLLLGAACMETRSFARQENRTFFDRENVTVLITDSGLGGLAITADAARRLQEHKGFRSVHLIFFNALFSREGGYNSLSSRAEKIAVFNSALRSMQARFTPDLILIGCNTLSALYPDTPFSQAPPVLVKGIIETGVEEIAQKLREFPDSRVIILGTQTTVEEGKYQRKLEAKGFLEERIQTQACPDLIPYIERDHSGPETEMLITAYVQEVLSRIPPPPTPLVVSLNCTHYGYSLDLWRKAFRLEGVEPLAILNPNGPLLDFLDPTRLQNRFPVTELRVEVVSAVEIGKEELGSLGPWLERLSPETSEALVSYRWDPDLFEWESLVRRD